jgi:uncharacterized membrane protein YccC
MRQREELSTTIAPACANLGAHSPEVEPPAENSACALQGTADGARGGERDDLARGEAALAQQLEHQRAHLAGCADDGDSVAVLHARQGIGPPR